MVMPAETDFPCHRSNAMNGKTAFVLLSSVLSGSLCACVQPPTAALPAAPSPPPVAAPPPPPAPLAAPRPATVALASGRRRAKGCWSYHQTIALRHRCSIPVIKPRASAAEPSMWPRSPTPSSGRRATAQSILTDRPSRRSGRLIDKPSDDRARHFSGVDHWILGGDATGVEISVLHVTDKPDLNAGRSSCACA